MQPLSKLASVGLIALFICVICGNSGGQDAGKQPSAKQPVPANQKPATKAIESTSKTTDKPATAANRSNTPNPAAPTVEMTPDEVAVRKTGDTFEVAFNKGDAKAAAEHYTKDAEYVDDDGLVYQGRAAIEQSLKIFFEGHPGSKIEMAVNSIRFIGPGVAIEDGVTAITLPNIPEPVFTRYTAVHAKADGKWLVASVRESVIRLPRQHQAKLKQLDWMTGEWVHEGSDAIIVFNCQPADNGNFLVRTFAVKIAGQESVSGTQRIGWDAQSDRLRSWIFDSDGGHSDGYWHQDGDSWILKSTGVTADGQPASGTSVYTFANPHTMTFQTIDHEVSGVKLPDSPKVTIVRHPPRPE